MIPFPHKIGMKKRPSRGIVILGVGLIIYSYFCYKGFDAENLQVYKNVFAAFHPAVAMVFFYTAVVLNVMGIISGAGVLLLREIFRKIIIVTAGINILLDVLTAFLFAPHISSYFKEIIAGYDIPTAPVDQASIFFNVMWFVAAVLIIWDIGFSLLLIYFFRHPIVRAQFRANLSA